MTWNELDWSALDRLRAGFLSGSAAAGPYWQSAADLASYDFTYGTRIGWKWDHALRELVLRGWRPRSRTLFDWGCGSGIAARRVLDAFGPATFDALTVWDHSPAACDYAAAAAQAEFPALAVSTATPGLLAPAATAPVGLLVISHVLNELPAAALASLRGLIARADAVLWVEPGTHEVSRALSRLRDELLAPAGAFHVVAPCTHATACPMLDADHARDWCHFFAAPPSEIFAHSEWVKFGQRAGVDLRSLPYAFLALDRTAPATPDGLAHVIGRPEHFKPYARALSCDATGLAELTISKRHAPALFKQLDRTKAPLVYRWERDGLHVHGGAPFAAAAPGPAPDDLTSAPAP